MFSSHHYLKVQDRLQWLTSLSAQCLKITHHFNTLTQRKLLDLSHLKGSVVDHPLNRIKALPLVWDVERLKDVREGSVVTTHSTDGSLQVKEALLLQEQKAEEGK